VSFTDYSLDIETMGVGPRAVICQIGICEFDRHSGLIEESTCIDVDIESCVEIGGTLSTNTIAWWAKQKQGFSYADKNNVVDIESALHILFDFIWDKEDGDPKPFWVKGPHFDIAILEFYYDHFELQNPWKYNKVRDMRTLIDIYNNPSFAYEITHNALDDATNQAMAISMMLRGIKA